MNFRKKLLVVGVSAAIITLSGCSSNSVRVSELEDALKKKETENESLRTSLAGMESRPAAAAPVAGSDLLPPDAKSGECYARVWVPAAYRDKTSEVLVRGESERVEIIPASYGWGEETVLVSEASSRIETIPAVYATETETVLVSPAVRTWKVSLAANAAPASDEILAAAKAHGIDLDAAEPGMCFHEHFLPAKFTTEEKEVLVSEGDRKVGVNKAKYRWAEKQVLVKEASFRMEEVPASYRWEEETILDKPAHTIWKKGTGPIQRIDESTGEIMCLVEIPASYKTIRRKVVDVPASTRRIQIPAEYKTVRVRELVEDASAEATDVPAVYKTVKVQKKIADPVFVWHEVHNRELPASTRTGHKICLTETPAKYNKVTRTVVKTPASTRKVEIPAQYETIKVRTLIAEAQEKRITVPAEYETVTTRELASEGHMEWRSILCDTNMTNARITQIQQALKSAGYNPGPIDGVVGAGTIAAVNAFQRDKGLPVDKYLNLTTLKALGVSTR